MYHRYQKTRRGCAFLFFFGILMGGVAGGTPPSAARSFEDAKQQLGAFDASLSFHDRKILKETGLRSKDQLSPSLKRLYVERRRLKDELTYWENVARLDEDLLKLPGKEDLRDSEIPKRTTEAGQIAKTAIRAFGELRQKYEMVRPAILHNLLVNVGIKNEGLCWQWTRDLRKELLRLDLKTYDLQWATAREGTMREHNTVVVVTRGRPLEDGILLDGWTHSGKPFWLRVPDDKKHPWKPGSYSGDDLTVNRLPPEQ